MSLERKKPTADLPKPPPPRRGVGWRVAGAVALTLTFMALGAIYPVMVKRDAWLHVEWRYWWVILGLAVVPLLWWWGTFGQDRRRTRLKLGTTIPLRAAPASHWPRPYGGVAGSTGDSAGRKGHPGCSGAT